jgi:hypothetical protein
VRPAFAQVGLAFDTISSFCEGHNPGTVLSLASSGISSRVLTWCDENMFEAEASVRVPLGRSSRVEDGGWVL